MRFLMDETCDVRRSCAEVQRGIEICKVVRFQVLDTKTGSFGCIL